MKKFAAILFAAFIGISCFAQPNPQTKSITEKFFPDPDIEINTPAFQKKKGYTDYEEMMAYLNALKAAHTDIMSISFIGESQKGKSIPEVRLKKGSGEKIRVWMQGGLHGNEPGSTEGMLWVINQLLNDPANAYLLDKLEIAFVPMANIDGYEKMDRYAANGLDLNRDQTKLEAPESVYLKQAFSDFKPQVAVDFHEYKPYRKNFVKLSTFGVTNPYDVMFLFSGNLNVPENLRHYTKDTFVENAVKVLEENNLTTHEYFSESTVAGDIHFNQGSLNARSSATNYALSNTISTLIEIRGVGIGRTSFIRRVNAAYLVAESYLKTAYDHVDEIKRVLAEAEQDESEAVVKMKSKTSEQPITLIDLETEETIEITVNLREAWYTEPVISRQRPTAYLILPGNEQIIEKLKVLGVTIEQLTSARNIEVETYTVAEYQQDALKYEGVKRQNIMTSVEVETVDFPEGTYIVPMNQARANMAIEVLEPEAPNSFVTFDVLHTEPEAELPVYRYLLKETL